AAQIISRRRLCEMNDPLFDLTGKVALVTGGSKGIGLGMALALARFGARLAIAGRNEADGEAAVAQFQTQGYEAKFFRADVTDKQQVAQMVSAVVDAYGEIHILLNNAGM